MILLELLRDNYYVSPLMLAGLLISSKGYDQETRVPEWY